MGRARLDGRPVALTGRDVVAAILAVGLVLVILTVAGGVVRGEYTVSGDGALGGIIGAMLVALAHYLDDRRQPR